MIRLSRSAGWWSVSLLLFGVGGAMAQDWPQYRGPNRDGKASGFKAPATWPEKLTKKWDVPIGSGVSNPSLVGDRLFVITREGDNEFVRCLNATTGDKVWDDSYPSARVQSYAATGGFFVGPRATPTVSGGRVVTLGALGMLKCYDAATGKEAWKHDEFVGQVPGFYTASSPIVVDGLCIVQMGAGLGEGKRPGDVLGAMIAYDLATGEEKWRAQDGSPSYASPQLMTIDGMKVIVAVSESQLVAVNAANGQVLWKIPHKQSRYNAASPIIDGQTLIFAGPEKLAGLTAVKLTKQGDELKEEEAWVYTGNNIIFNTPVLKDGSFYGISDRDLLFAVNGEHATGWTAPIVPPLAAVGQWMTGGSQNAFALAQEPQAGDRGEAGGQREGQGRGQAPRRGQQRGRGNRAAGGGERPGYGTVVDAGSVLIATCPLGDLIVFKPDATAYTEIKRYKVSEDGEAYSHPILSGNRIYIKDKDSVALWIVE